MTGLFMLDTNILSDIIRNPDGKAVKRMAEMGDATVCPSVMVACELRYGAAKRASSALTQRVAALLEIIPVMPVGFQCRSVLRRNPHGSGKQGTLHRWE